MKAGLQTTTKWSETVRLNFTFCRACANQWICWRFFISFIFFYTGMWKGCIKESGICNHIWQANVCERGREWGMALSVTNVSRGRVLTLFQMRKEKVSLSANNGETKEILTLTPRIHQIRVHCMADRFHSNICVNFHRVCCAAYLLRPSSSSLKPSGTDTQDFHFWRMPEQQFWWI